MRQIGYMVMVLASLNALAQHTFTIKGNDGEPLVGATALVRDINTNEEEQLIADIDGRFTTHLTLPAEIEIRYVGYETLKTVVSKSNPVLQLIPSVAKLEDVIIESDPYRNVAIDRKIYEVDEIDKREIMQLGGNNLADILNYQMNITITPDASTGRSTVSMFGLSGEYVKILVDNVPIVSDNGVGNNIDITQIGIENVERIELVEGSMGVLYGANAVAGVLNIITKKGIDAKWNISASIQEESVGKEYAWFDQGRHIQNVSLSRNFDDKLYASIGYQRNDFKGYLNGYRGENHTISTTEISKERGYEWSPKLQNNINGLINYQINSSIGFFYKYDRYDETLDIYDRVVNSSLGIDGLNDFTATDEQFKTTRNSHQLNFTSQLRNGLDLNFLLAYQTQERNYEDYTYDIERQVKIGSQGIVTNQSSDLLFSKTTINNLLGSSRFINLSVGLETEHQEGYDGIASGLYSDTIAIQTLDYKDIFTNATLFKESKFNLIPGARINFNSRYSNHLIWSLTANYKLSNELSTRVILGSAYKTPSFTELFRYFVDANHNVTGNANLNPEDGISILWTTTRKKPIVNGSWKSTIKGYHFDIREKISLSTIIEENPDSPSDIQRSTYLNVDRYKSIGVSTDQSVEIGKMEANLGAEYFGVQQSRNGELDDSYFFRWNIRSQLKYNFKTGFTLAWYTMYNGGGERYFETASGPVKGKIDGFTFMDASLSKTFKQKGLSFILGSRNILNVVSVNAVGLPGGAHGGSGPSSIFLANGRSYYLRLAYNLNF